MRTQFRKDSLIASLCLAMIACSGCSRHANIQPTPFPASNEVAGWVKSGETRTFPAAELWNYIDGDADRYVRAGVQTTSTSDYNFENKFDAVVDVYTMSSDAGARTILESEPAGDATSTPIGEATRLHAASLAFCKGSRLVRIVAYKQAPEVQPALLVLGRQIERRIPE